MIVWYIIVWYGACLCVDVPHRPFNHLRIQPLIVTKFFSLFFGGLQLYFDIVFSYGKVARDWLSVCFRFCLFFPLFHLLLFYHF